MKDKPHNVSFDLWAKWKKSRYFKFGNKCEQEAISKIMQAHREAREEEFEQFKRFYNTNEALGELEVELYQVGWKLNSYDRKYIGPFTGVYLVSPTKKLYCIKMIPGGEFINVDIEELY